MQTFPALLQPMYSKIGIRQIKDVARKSCAGLVVWVQVSSVICISHHQLIKCLKLLRTFPLCLGFLLLISSYYKIHFQCLWYQSLTWQIHQILNKTKYDRCKNQKHVSPPVLPYSLLFTEIFSKFRANSLI